MDVRGVGSGPGQVDPAGGGRSAGAPKSPGPVPPGSDSVGGLLEELTEADLVRLLELMERSPSPEAAARVQDLFRAAVRAAAENNVTLAIESLAQLAPLDPRRAESLPSEPALTHIRPHVEALLAHLTAAARVEAQSRIATATHLVGPDGQRELLLAGRIAESSGYANVIAVTQLTQMLVERMSAAQAAQARRAAMWLPAFTGVRRLWRRAPLLVLLLGWLIFGLLGCILLLAAGSSLVAAGFQIWGLGFLVLTAFGFYMRIRNVRL